MTSTQTPKTVKLVVEIECKEDLLNPLSLLFRSLDGLGPDGTPKVTVLVEPRDSEPFFDLSISSTAQTVKNLLAYSRKHDGTGDAASIPVQGLLFLDLKEIAKNPNPVIMTLLAAYHEYLHIKNPLMKEEEIAALGHFPKMIQAIFEELKT